VRDSSAILAVQNFCLAYSEVPVVRSVSLTLAPGEIVAVLGRNGMGKTTLLRGIVGLTPVRTGGLKIAGAEMINATPDVMARAGIGYVPAGRGIFGSLSVRENLIMCARNSGEDEYDLAIKFPAIARIAEHVQGVVSRWARPDFLQRASALPVNRSRLASGIERRRSSTQLGNENCWTLERVLTLFPRLAERLSQGGQNLSGGEQQMLAIGRALMTNPRLLLIDEATEGLAPLVARDIWRTVGEICRSGVAAMVVDRDVRQLAKIARRAVVMFKGEIVFDGEPDRLLGDRDLIQRYIGL
jgi:branched-chain amino acid transport system ATP-binding protein